MADVKGVLQKLFPFISAAASVGGPLGTLAASAVGKALGIDKVDPTSDAVTAAINGATPDQIIALKKAEQDFQLQMTEFGYKDVETLQQIAADDRDSARKREVALKDKYVPFLATLVIGSFILTVLAILRGWGRVEAAFAGTLIGYLAANANQVVSYYFGSSAGSANKDVLLANSVPVDKK